MAVLVLNIGKSDVLIKSSIYENYWIPIGFDRDEPNLKLSSAPDNEKTIWKDREEIIVTEIYPKLGMEEPKRNFQGKYIINFRELTEAIWQANSNDDGDNWHSIIRPSGRLIGAIETILNKFKLEKVYIFVTDQKTDENLRGHDGDSCFSFKIFQKWFTEETKYQHLEIEPITLRFDPRPQDKTLEFYYDSLNKLIVEKKIKEEDILAISIKGGTPQMQTALQMQAIASGISKQLFIEPKVDVSRILTGENSECRIISYWRYERSQRYQIVKLLLNKRWDFQGARIILQEWQSTLDFLNNHLEQEDTKQLKQEREKIKTVTTKYLKKAEDNLNLSSQEINNEVHYSMLNLYTQCRIYWELEEIANVLPRLSTFYEEALHLILNHFGESRWFVNDNRESKWIFDINQVPETLVNCYQEVEKEFDKNIDWTYNFKLNSRYRKRNFAEALVKYSNDNEKLNIWQNIITNLKKIDYWIDKRNDLIHAAKGLTLDTMEKELIDDQKNYRDKGRKNPYKPNPEIACNYQDILERITCICEQVIKLIGQKPNIYVGYEENTPRYIYSNIRELVINKLMQ
jgi:hypothetical protein